MNKGIIFVISGPAGSGKGTVVSLVREMIPEMGFSVSATTRGPRPGEKEGVHYYYITKEEFERKIASGEILEHTVYCGNYYGTPKSELERVTSEGRDIILEIEVEGSLQIKKLFPDAVSIMLTPPDGEELEARLRGRGTETDEVVKERLRRAKEELGLISKYDYVVVNRSGKADECAALVKSIIIAEHARASRNGDFAKTFFKNNK